MACSSCGKPRVNPTVVNRNTGLASRSAAPAKVQTFDSQSIAPRVGVAVASNPNAASKRAKI
jgi:hypothetical protein